MLTADPTAVTHSLLNCDFLRLYQTIRLHYGLAVCTLLKYVKWSYELYSIDDTRDTCAVSRYFVNTAVYRHLGACVVA